MMTKKQILNRLAYLKKKNSQYCIAIKAVVSKDEILQGKADAAELRLVPLQIDTDEQYDYTRRFVNVMIGKDNREVVFFSTEKLEYIAIIGADSEEDGNCKIEAAIRAYSAEHGFNQCMREEKMLKLAEESVSEYVNSGGEET